MSDDPSTTVTTAASEADLRLVLQKHIAHQLVTSTKAADAEAWSRAYKNLQPEAAANPSGSVSEWTLASAFTQLNGKAKKARTAADKARSGAAAREKKEEQRRTEP